MPFLGKIAAGRPIEALAQAETIQVPPRLSTPGPCHDLQITGNWPALDGGYVVIEHRNRGRNGAIIVTLLRGGKTTVKRIVQEPGRVILVPENSLLEPIMLALEDVEIQGVPVGHMQAYE